MLFRSSWYMWISTACCMGCNLRLASAMPSRVRVEHTRRRDVVCNVCAYYDRKYCNVLCHPSLLSVATSLTVGAATIPSYQPRKSVSSHITSKQSHAKWRWRTWPNQPWRRWPAKQSTTTDCRTKRRQSGAPPTRQQARQGGWEIELALPSQAAHAGTAGPGSCCPSPGR